MTQPRLTRLATQPLKGREGEARAEAAAERLRGAWGLVVGPALVKHTVLLRVHRGRLMVGCWQPDVLKALRESAEATWPQVRERVQRLLALRLVGLDIVPCDPPPPPPPQAEAQDPFKAVLAKLRELGGGGKGR